MKSTIITTVFNESKSIQRFLDSLVAQTVKPNEIVIVDGGSTDKTAVIIKDFSKKHPELNIRLIIDSTCSKKHVPGPIARGRNVAIKQASGEVIAATDAGCILEPNWFEEITKPFLDSKVMAIAGWYISTRKNSFQRAYEAALMPAECQIHRFNFLPSSRSVAFRKHVWEQVGGYPEDSFTGEDTAFCLNILKVGITFYRAPSAIVQWDCPESWSCTWKKHFSYGIGEGQLGILKIRFFLRWIFLFVPFNFLSNPRKIPFFPVAYLGLLAHQMGYLRGLRDSKSISTSVSARAKA